MITCLGLVGNGLMDVADRGIYVLYRAFTSVGRTLTRMLSYPGGGRINLHCESDPFLFAPPGLGHTIRKLVGQAELYVGTVA